VRKPTLCQASAVVPRRRLVSRRGYSALQHSAHLPLAHLVHSAHLPLQQAWHAAFSAAIRPATGRATNAAASKALSIVFMFVFV
jgi:hypothetical protein